VEDCNCLENNKDYSKPIFTVLIKNLSSTFIKMFGENFNYSTLNGLYLSTNNPQMSSIVLDIFSNIKSISSKFVPIEAFPVETYEYKYGEVSFYLPNNLLAGNYDIIYINNAGYFKASNSLTFTYFTVTTSFSSHHN
jgi:hypothetical protein